MNLQSRRLFASMRVYSGIQPGRESGAAGPAEINAPAERGPLVGVVMRRGVPVPSVPDGLTGASLLVHGAAVLAYGAAVAESGVSVGVFSEGNAITGLRLSVLFGAPAGSSHGT